MKNIMFFVAVMFCLAGFAYAFSGSGTGTLANPFVITNCTQLQEMNASTNANYTLGNNIDCSGTVTWNSGLGFSPVTTTYAGSFKGSLKGQGYNITGFYINRTTNNVGLFGYTGSSANITNFSMIGASITGGTYVGGVVAYSYGSVSYVYFTGNVSSTGGEAGGIVGVNDGPVSYCYAKGIFSATSSGMIGGVFGDSIDSKSAVSNCYAEGSVSGAGQGVGGFSGRSYGPISNSYSKANVSSSSTGIGGFVGTNYNTVSNSYSMGNVSASNPYYTCGFSDTGTTSSCYYDSQTSFAFYTGSYCSNVAKTTVQMRNQTTYSGWNFTGIWNISSEWNEGYPYLKDLGALPSSIGINIIYPANNGNYSNVTTINYTVSSVGTLDKCWYSTDSGATNSSLVTAGTNISSVSSSTGTNLFTVYCNTTNNLAASTTNFTIKNLQIQLISPTGNINAAQNRTFQVTVNVTCLYADCGNVSVSLDPATINLVPNGGFESGSLTNWTTGGNANWAAQSTTVKEGTYAGKAGTIGDNQNTWIYQNVTLTTAANITFSWKVSSESSWDYLGFCVNKTFGAVGCTRGTGTVTAISGTVDWTTVTYALPAGRSQLLWYYAKDSSASSGSDTGWIDNVTIAGVSSTKVGLVSTIVGDTPFWANTSNPQYIILNNSQSSLVSWYVNATGNINSNHTFFAYANITGTSIGAATNTWNVTIVNSTADTTAPSFTAIANQIVEYGTAVSYKINATDDYAVSCFGVNDTTNFKINCSGYLENNTALGVALYRLNITVNDTSGNANSALMSVNVTDTTVPIFTAIANQTIGQGTALGYDINATDLSGIGCFAVNDTSNFKINCSGYLENNTLLNVSFYWLNITANDTYNNRNYNLMWVNVTDTTAPIVTLNSPAAGYWNDTSSPFNVTFNCSATDNYNLKNISLYITNSTNQSFSLNSTMNITGTSNSTNWTLGLSNGNYTWNCLAYDSFGYSDWNDNNRSVIINFTDTDNDGIADSQDHLEGNESNVSTTGVSNLNITVSGNSTYGSYNNAKEVVFYDSTTKIINFTHNFSSSQLDLGKIVITKSTNYIIVNLSGQVQPNYNKTLYIADNNFASLCVKDAEISSIGDMSSVCNGANETDFTSCLGSSATLNGISCTDEGSTIKIGNLRYSAVRGAPASPSEQTPVISGSGGGATTETPKVPFIRALSPKIIYECYEDSDCRKNQYCFEYKCHNAECSDNNGCDEDESCWNKRCIKWFDMEILEFESPVKLGEFFEFTYLLKSIVKINGDVEVSFWIEKGGNIVTSGQDTIYFGSSEEKIKNKKLFLPRDISSGNYIFRIKVTYGTYIASAHRTIEIGVNDGMSMGMATIKMSPGYDQYIIYVLIVLCVSFIFLIGPRKEILEHLRSPKTKEETEYYEILKKLELAKRKRKG